MIHARGRMPLLPIGAIVPKEIVVQKVDVLLIQDRRNMEGINPGRINQGRGGENQLDGLIRGSFQQLLQLVSGTRAQKIDFPGKIVLQLEPKQFGITGAVDNDQSPFALGNFVHGNHQADRQTGNLIFQQVIAQNLLCNGNDPAGNLIGKGVILPDFRHQHGALAKCKVMVCQHGENMIPEGRAVGKIKTVCFLKIEKKAVGNFVHLLILELLHDGGMEKPLVTELLKHTNPVFLG